MVQFWSDCGQKVSKRGKKDGGLTVGRLIREAGFECGIVVVFGGMIVKLCIHLFLFLVLNGEFHLVICSSSLCFLD